MRRGTVILTPFPFTDLRGNRVRPAVIISSYKRRGEDIIISFISSVFDESKLQETDFVLKTENERFKETGLKNTSVFKMDKVATVDKRIILGELGTVPQNIMEKLDGKLKVALGLK